MMKSTSEMKVFSCLDFVRGLQAVDAGAEVVIAVQIVVRSNALKKQHEVLETKSYLHAYEYYVPERMPRAMSLLETLLPPF